MHTIEDKKKKDNNQNFYDIILHANSIGKVSWKVIKKDYNNKAKLCNNGIIKK